MLKKIMSKLKKLSPPQIQFFSVPYPPSFFDDIKKGKKMDFLELTKTGLVAGFLTFDRNEANRIQNDTNSNPISQPQLLEIVFEEEQKKLDRFCDITQKTGKIDRIAFDELFTTICYASTLFSKYKNADQPILVSTKMLRTTWGSTPLNGYFVAIATHPDLLLGENMNHLADITIKKYVGIYKKPKSKPRTRWSEAEKEQVRTRQKGLCAICEKPPPRWEYDHIDEARDNKDLSNCQGLCPNCHSVKTYDDKGKNYKNCRNK